MRAAVYHGARDVRITEMAVAAPRRGEATVAVAYCGICGSDLHEYLDGPHAIPVREPHPASGLTAPLVLGHEFCGTVTAVGADVPEFAPGDRVAVEPNYRCGTCPRCLVGDYHLCRHFGFAGLMGNGGLAEFATVPAYMLHRLPDTVSFEQAALFEPAAVALHALRRSGVDRETTVAVVGLGPIGLLAVRLLAWSGVPRIVAVDVARPRLRLAGGLGATDLVHPGGADPAARIRELTGGQGVDTAFEVVGSQDTVRICLDATRKGGRVILVGLAGELRVDAFSLVNNEQSIITSVGYRDCHPELIRLVAEEGVDLSPVVTATIGLDEVVGGGFEALLGGGAQIKVLVRPGAGHLAC